MQAAIIRICAAVLLVGAFWNFGVAFRGVPAFDATARQESALGDWRLPLGSAMYDRGMYLFQLGYGYANIDESVLVITNAAETDELRVRVAERHDRAIAFLSEAVSVDPGNAHAWTWLAWSQSAVGEIEAARASMGTSWSIAPHNREAAIARLDFAALVQEFSEFEADDVPPLTDAEVEAVRKDFAVLNLRDADLRDEYIAVLPFLAAE